MSARDLKKISDLENEITTIKLNMFPKVGKEIQLRAKVSDLDLEDDKHPIEVTIQEGSEVHIFWMSLADYTNATEGL